MSKYNRYCFIKKNFPDYVVFIKGKENLITFDWDLKIYESFNKEFFDLNINYIIVDGLVLNFFKKESNNYFYYFKVTLLITIIKFVEKKKKIMT